MLETSIRASPSPHSCLSSKTDRTMQGLKQGGTTLEAGDILCIELGVIY